MMPNIYTRAADSPAPKAGALEIKKRRDAESRGLTRELLMRAVDLIEDWEFLEERMATDVAIDLFNLFCAELNRGADKSHKNDSSDTQGYP
jgi:hypothetical protein